MASEPRCPYSFCAQIFRKGDILLQVVEVVSDPSFILPSAIVRPGAQQGMDVAQAFAHAECVMQAMFAKHAFATPAEELPVIVERTPRKKITNDDVRRAVESDA